MAVAARGYLSRRDDNASDIFVTGEFEAQRIENKHLLTLEPGISENQTDEMKSKKLQMVLPAAIHESYRPPQRAWLMNVVSFVELVVSRQTSA